MSREQEIKKLEKILLLRRDALRKALAGDLSALQDLRERNVGDEIDFAIDSEQDEINSQMVEIESRELDNIEHALEKIREGTYGICEVTGKPIPLARLKALPYATMCIEAQRELEKRQARGDHTPLRSWDRLQDEEIDVSSLSLDDIDASEVS